LNPTEPQPPQQESNNKEGRYEQYERRRPFRRRSKIKMPILITSDTECEEGNVPRPNRIKRHVTEEKKNI
jgi:hypothetical protein